MVLDLFTAKHGFVSPPCGSITSSQGMSASELNYSVHTVGCACNRLRQLHRKGEHKSRSLVHINSSDITGANEASVYSLELTPRSCVILKKLTVAQLVKKLPDLWGARRFITLVPYAEPDKSNSQPPDLYFQDSF